MATKKNIAICKNALTLAVVKGYNSCIVNSPLIVNGPLIRARLRSGDFFIGEYYEGSKLYCFFGPYWKIVTTPQPPGWGFLHL